MKYARAALFACLLLASLPFVVATLFLFPACATPKEGEYQGRSLDDTYRQMKRDEAAERHAAP